jgi:hypothetical protein
LAAAGFLAAAFFFGALFVTLPAEAAFLALGAFGLRAAAFLAGLAPDDLAAAAAFAILVFKVKF